MYRWISRSSFILQQWEFSSMSRGKRFNSFYVNAACGVRGLLMQFRGTSYVANSRSFGDTYPRIMFRICALRASWGLYGNLVGRFTPRLDSGWSTTLRKADAPSWLQWEIGNMFFANQRHLIFPWKIVRISKNVAFLSYSKITLLMLRIRNITVRKIVPETFSRPMQCETNYRKYDSYKGVLYCRRESDPRGAWLLLQVLVFRSFMSRCSSSMSNPRSGAILLNSGSNIRWNVAKITLVYPIYVHTYACQIGKDSNVGLQGQLLMDYSLIITE